MDYRERIKRVRDAIGLSQQALSNLIGVTVVTVNRWENGEASPRGPAGLVIECLEKIVATDKVGELREELRSGRLAGGTAPAYHRIFSMAFGLPTEPSMIEAAPPATLMKSVGLRTGTARSRLGHP